MTSERFRPSHEGEDLKGQDGRSTGVAAAGKGAQQPESNKAARKNTGARTEHTKGSRGESSPPRTSRCPRAALGGFARARTCAASIRAILSRHEHSSSIDHVRAGAERNSAEERQHSRAMSSDARAARASGADDKRVWRVRTQRRTAS